MGRLRRTRLDVVQQHGLHYRLRREQHLQRRIHEARVAPAVEEGAVELLLSSQYNE